MSFPDKHVFVLGASRSGTRMLSRVLGRSSNCYLITEHFKKETIPEEENPLRETEYWRRCFAFPHAPAEDIEYDESSFAQLNELWKERAGGKRLILKNPQNLVRAHHIRRAFPNAQFVWLLRDPWFVLQSMIGRKPHRRTRMLRAREIYALPDDPGLRAAASWALGVTIMRTLKTEADVVTSYERLVTDTTAEIERICRQLALVGALENGAADIPKGGRADLSLARYVMRRSPNRRRIMEIVAPLAEELGYPPRPCGGMVDHRLLGWRFFLNWLNRPKEHPPYGFPRLQKARGAFGRFARRWRRLRAGGAAR